MESDEEVDRLRGQVIQYNRETGYGRFRREDDDADASEYGKDVSFRVLRPMQADLNSVVIDAMKEASVVGEFLVTRDQEGKPKSLLLVGLSDGTEDEI